MKKLAIVVFILLVAQSAYANQAQRKELNYILNFLEKQWKGIVLNYEEVNKGVKQGNKDIEIKFDWSEQKIDDFTAMWQKHFPVTQDRSYSFKDELQDAYIALNRAQNEFYNVHFTLNNRHMDKSKMTAVNTSGVHHTKQYLIIARKILSNPNYIYSQEYDQNYYGRDVKNIKLVSNDSMAIAILNALAFVSEEYYNEKGSHARRLDDFKTMKKPEYTIPERIDPASYCGRSTAGFSFQCQYGKSGYELIATPLKKDVTGFATYKVANGTTLNREESLEKLLKALDDNRVHHDWK